MHGLQDGKSNCRHTILTQYIKKEKKTLQILYCIPNEKDNDSDENEVSAYVNFLVTKMAPKSISLEDIKSETAKDISSVAVKTALLSGKWYGNPILEPYRRFQNELTDHEGIILRETRIVLPKSLQKRALQIEHKDI